MILILGFPYTILSMVSLLVMLTLQAVIAMMLVVEATDKDPSIFC